MTVDLHPAVQDLIDIGQKRSWLSYEELNNTLPDEMVDAERLHELLAYIDATGIEMVDELERWLSGNPLQYVVSRAYARGLP